jgi:exosome complex protein LRP1
MDSAALVSLIEKLDDDIDDLEEALLPLIETSIAETAGKMPLLDRAKFYALTTYAIESIIFCSLSFGDVTQRERLMIVGFIRLNGADAKQHPVFRELTRVKQYFDKIEEIETGPEKRENMSLDKAAASRIVKHALVIDMLRD